MADRLDDLICTFHPGTSAMETLALLLLGWIIFGAILTIAGRFLYSKLLDVPKESPVRSVTASAAPVQNVEKPNISNTERFINTLKSHPPPTLTKLTRSKSGSTKSVDSHPDLPIISGSNSDCVKWVTSLLTWLYTRTQVLNDLNLSWKEALNVQTRKSETETGVSVEFQQMIFLDDHPTLANVFCEITPNDHVTITGDFESHFAILVRACRERRDHQTVSDYRVQVERLRGRLNISCNANDLTASLKFDGWPEVKLSLVTDKCDTNSTIDTDEHHLLDVLVEMVTSALRSASMTLNWARYNDIPRFCRTQNPAEPILPVHYDSMLDHGNRLVAAGRDKKLLVKIVKANNLGSQKGCREISCIIEMDEPPQRHQTSVKHDTENPFWDENFLFDLASSTEEILFELYDRFQNREMFLGLGIVGMEELLMNPSQRQIIPLQSRPYENDPVSGTLTVEFLFVDPMEIPQGIPGLLAAGKYTAIDNESRLVRRDSYHRATKLNSELQLTTEGPRKVESFVKETDNRANSRSTFLVQSNQREEELKESTDFTDPLYPEADFTFAMGSVASSLSSKGEEDRNRSRSRKRSFFRSLKERLSRSKNRSRSVDPGLPRDDSLTRDSNILRSVSADRAQSSCGTMGSGHLLAVPGVVPDVDSARSSLSEVSGTSTASTRTYLDEASTLVLETIENGIRKHYLIPLALAEKRKWKKKGVKLHIFSDHVFVARHLPGGTACQVCGQPLARRPGKQGYECRDCLLRCHKPCHVKVESLCPNSTVHYMELEFVEDTGDHKLRRH